MKRYIKTEELKTLQLEMMDDIHSFCEKNNIRYVLAYGTLIGAIRHKGYIPWDDDIDIWMPRPDYEKFVGLYNEETSPFRMVCVENNNDYVLPFGKVHDSRTVMNESMYEENTTFGVYIDVFPLDGFYDKKSLEKARNLRRVLNAKKAKLGRGRGIIKDITIAIAKCFLLHKSIRDILSEIDYEIRKADFSSSAKVGYLPTIYKGDKGIYPRSFFEETMLTDFEGRKYRIPVEYDKILTSEYGNYMAYPPEDKRCSTHKFEAWWKI